MVGPLLNFAYRDATLHKSPSLGWDSPHASNTPGRDDNNKGFFAYPSLPAGRYEFKVDREGFSPPRLTVLVVDDQSALQTDTTLTMIEKIEQVTLLANDVHVETSSTQASEVVTGTAITTLHGRSFSLMALEPGIVP